MSPLRWHDAVARAKEQRGATAVEFAIVFPLALIFIFTLMYFGFRALIAVATNEIAREGARFASVRESNVDDFPTEAEVEAYLDASHIPGWLPAPDVSVSTVGEGSGSRVTVTVTFQDLGLLNVTGSAVSAIGAVFFDTPDSGLDFNDVSKSVAVRRE
jgi:Flp pilus assembly protein TadG